MRTWGVAILAGLVAVGCAQAPGPSLAGAGGGPTTADACAVVAAARRALDFRQALAPVQHETAEAPPHADLFELEPAVRADLERGAGYAGAVDGLRRACADERGLAPAGSGGEANCGASFTRPWFGASGRTAVIGAFQGCRGGRSWGGGRGGTCVLRRDADGVWRAAACEVVVVSR